MAILGGSGIGKSTLFQLLLRFYMPGSGVILVNAIEWSAFSTKAWRDTVAVVEQETKLFNGSVLYNIGLTSAAGEEGVIEFCKKLGFDSYFETFPQGYYTILGEQGVKLSGGQKQLVAIARALYKQPQLLLMDEGTASMDSHVELFVIQLLRQVQKNMAILLITHKPEVAALMDRQLFLSR